MAAAVGGGGVVMVDVIVVVIVVLLLLLLHQFYIAPLQGDLLRSVPSPTSVKQCCQREIEQGGPLVSLLSLLQQNLCIQNI